MERNGTHLESSGGDKSQVHKLREAVEAQHGGKAKFVQIVPVLEMSGGQAISNTLVSVFDLRGCTRGAFRAYAWARETPEGGRNARCGLAHTLDCRPNSCSPLNGRSRSKDSEIDQCSASLEFLLPLRYSIQASQDDEDSASFGAHLVDCLMRSASPIQSGWISSH